MSGHDEEVEKGQERGKKVNLDTILIEELGGFGRYQLYTLGCLIPECEDVDSDFTASWRDFAIPKLQSGAFDQCSRFGSNSSQWTPNGTCPASLFDSSTTEPCQDYVYENNYSIVKEFDLACEEWRRSQIGSIRTIGNFIMLTVAGYVSDRWGRRTVIVFSELISAILGLARSFVTSYEWFLALEVLEAGAGCGVFSAIYVLMTELVAPKYRVAVGATVSTMYSVGHVILGFLAWQVPYWRTLTRILYTPMLFFIFYYWILTESVRWLISKGRFEEAETILEQVAKTNKKELSEKSLTALRKSTQEQKIFEKPNETWLIFLVFKSPVILKRCCITPVWWVSMTLVYYGLSINAVNLSGNRYLNYAIVSAIEIPGFWTAILLLDRIGRKAVVLCGFLLCAVCQFILAFMPAGMDILSLTIYLIGKYSISPVVTTLYIYTAELYPTRYRNNLLSFSSSVGRIGAIVAPLTPALAAEVWEPFPAVLFGSFALLSGLLVLLTPETLGTRLPDTFEEAEELEKKKTPQ